MGEFTEISWADSTFNPWIGCSPVSAACDFCYAEALMDHRYGKVQWGPHGERKRTKTWGDPPRWQRTAAEFFAAHGRRRRVFCASLADVWDNQVPLGWRVDLLDVIRQCPDLDWLLLTKRPQLIVRMLGQCGTDAHINVKPGLRDWIEAWIAGEPPDNVWLGISTENQTEADRRIDGFLDVAAVVHFLSIEPMLSHIDLSRWIHRNRYPSRHHSINWMITGGESGPNARLTHPDWFRGVRDQCAAAGVAYLHKQNGEFQPTEITKREFFYPQPRHQGENVVGPTGEFQQYPWPDDDDTVTVMRRVGKKAAGRLLDGREHNEFPRAA